MYLFHRTDEGTAGSVVLIVVLSAVGIAALVVVGIYWYSRKGEKAEE